MKLAINPPPPFDFDLSAKVFSDGDKQIRRYENGKYWRVIRVNNKLVLIIIKALGNVDEPRLLVELKSNEEISNSDKKMVEEIIFSLFNLKFDLMLFYEDLKNDKIISRLAQKLRGLKSPTTPTVFEALISSLVEQQISLNAAYSIERKMTKAFGDVLRIDDKVYYAFPTPQKLASVSIEQLRRCGLSLKKSEYIKGVSKSIIEGKLNLEEFKNYDIKEITEELCKIRGIGVWTAELTMVRGMHKLEAMPADDIGLRRCISHYYCNDEKISRDEARRIAGKWGKWKSLAGFYLIMAEKLGLEK